MNARRLLRQNASLLKLIVFIVVTSFTSLFVIITVDNSVGQATTSYKAIFSDAFGLQAGDDVRIAGVRIGRVDKTSVGPGGTALVGLSVVKDVAVTQTTFARIRYRDLLGRRYIALEDSSPGGVSLPKGTTIPMTRTAPALDLTVLFNGFRPVFQTLQPADVNKLAAQIISTFQGEGGTVDSLLASTASLTTTLAQRDSAIGRVVNNLDAVLNTVATRDTALSQLIVNLRNLAGGLAGDKDILGSSLGNIDAFVSATASLLSQTKPDIDSSIRSLRTVVATVDDNKTTLNSALKRLPTALEAAVRGFSYGSWLNLYLCDLNVLLPTGQVVDANIGSSQNAVCKP